MVRDQSPEKWHEETNPELSAIQSRRDVLEGRLEFSSNSRQTGTKILRCKRRPCEGVCFGLEKKTAG